MEHNASIPRIEIVFIGLDLVEVLGTGENGTAALQLLVGIQPFPV
jgi:hypothetical protein